MDYVKAFLIKYVMTSVILWIVLGIFYGVGVGNLLLLSLVITLVGFFLGDLYLLPRFENWGAVITDFLLVYVAILVFGAFFTMTPIPPISAAAISAIIISICEVFFHKYMDSHILHSDDSTGGRERNDLSPEERVQTEFGEEINPIDEDE